MGDRESAENIAKYVQGMLAEGLRGLEFVESATLIGLPVGKGRWFERVNDYDTVIVVDRMTPEKYEVLDKVFLELRNMGNGDVDVLYAIADGPMKPKTESQWEIFGHYIVHDRASYQQSPLVLVENSWQYEEPFLGEPLRELRTIPGVDKDMLLDSPLGIRHLYELVTNDESAYLGWEESDGRMEMVMHPIRFTTPEERMELYFYSILRCASNTLRLVTGNNQIGIGEDMALLFESYCGDFEMSGLPREIYQAKRNLRERRLILTDTAASHYQLQALDFLAALDTYISNRQI